MYRILLLVTLTVVSSLACLHHSCSAAFKACDIIITLKNAGTGLMRLSIAVMSVKDVILQKRKNKQAM